MRPTRFTEAQTVEILREHEAQTGRPRQSATG